MSKYLRRGMLIATLWCSTLAVPTALAQGEATSPDPNSETDNRIIIVTRPNERTLILRNMRKYLVGIQALSEAVANDDLKAAVEATRSMGSINLYDLRLMFANKASIAFHEIAFDVHKEFDLAANEADNKKDLKLLFRRVAATMKKCTYCHETFRLQDKAH